MAVKAWMIGMSAVMLASACASLVKPDVQTERAALRTGAYALDPAHGSILFKVDHFGFSNYVGRFEKFDASLDFDAASPEAASAEAVVDMTSLDVANDPFRATLLGKSWFDAAVYPQAAFRSTSVKPTGPNTGVLSGNLTLHGVTRPVALDVVFNGGAQDVLRRGYVVGFSAKGHFSRKEFGVDSFEGLVGDDVTIEIEAEFKKR